MEVVKRCSQNYHSCEKNQYHHALEQQIFMQLSIQSEQKLLFKTKKIEFQLSDQTDEGEKGEEIKIFDFLHF